MSEALEEQLLSYGENAENEGEEVEYLEEEELQVRWPRLQADPLSSALCCHGCAST